MQSSENPEKFIMLPFGIDCNQCDIIITILSFLKVPSLYNDDEIVLLPLPMRDSFVAGPFLMNRNSCAQILMRGRCVRCGRLKTKTHRHRITASTSSISSNCFHEKWTSIPKFCHEIWIPWIDLGSNVFPELRSFFLCLSYARAHFKF